MSDDDERPIPAAPDLEAIASLAGLSAFRAVEIQAGQTLSRIAEEHAAVAREATRFYKEQLSMLGVGALGSAIASVRIAQPNLLVPAGIKLSAQLLAGIKLAPWPGLKLPPVDLSLTAGIAAAASSKLVAGLGAMLAEWRENGPKVERMLVALGWPPPSTLPVDLVDQLAFEFEREALTAGDLDALLVEFYSAEEIDRVLRGWRGAGHMPHRMAIVEAAMRAHVEGNYLLSIPALLPQIEGVIADLFGHTGRLRQRELREYLAVIADRQFGWDRAGVVFLERTLQERFEWGDAIPRFSRHAILHGADTRYATAANSLRVILTLDWLQSTILFVAVDRGRRFHVASCARIGRRAGRSRRVFTSQSSARRAGLQPCRACVPQLAAR